MATDIFNLNKYFPNFNSFALKHAISSATAVFIAMYVNFYFSLSHGGLIVIAAFLASKTTRGTPLRQSFLCLFVIMLVIVVVTSLGFIFSNAEITVLIAILFLLSMMIALKQQLSSRNFFYSLVVALTLLAMLPLLPIQNGQVMRMQLLDVLIGGSLSIVCTRYLFRVRYEYEFRLAMVPIFDAMVNYVRILKNDLMLQSEDKDALDQAKSNMEKTLADQQGRYPEWVYETGFNPGLRAGFRFFLITIERTTEILFSLDYLARRLISLDALNVLSNDIASAMEKNIELIEVLQAYFSSNVFLDVTSNFTSDITKLENALHEVVPQQLELLDITPTYVRLTALVRDIRDLRELLLQLIAALPPTT